MKIFIFTMDDPVQTNGFIKKIIEARHNDIAGVAIPEGDRLKQSKGRSRLVYIISLLLIMGPVAWVKKSFVFVGYKIRKKMAVLLPFIKDPSLESFIKSYKIPFYRVKSPNNRDFLEILKKMDIDVIINQSQNIIKKALLEIPSFGVLNRHNALLPRNRGRLSPFWVLYHNEKETGISIHLVSEDLDAGDIIIQEKIPVGRHDNFNRLVKKSYELAPGLMLKALEKIEKNEVRLIPNDSTNATYNPVPEFKQALDYRWNRIKSIFG